MSYIRFFRTITEFSRFNSPVIKLSEDDYIVNSDSFTTLTSHNDFTRKGSINDHLQKLLSNNLMDHMEVIKERSEGEQTPAIKTNKGKVMEEFSKSPSQIKHSQEENKEAQIYLNSEELSDMLEKVSDRYDEEYVVYKEQGNLIQWYEEKTIGTAQYGDVIKAFNIKNGEIFAVKRLHMFKNGKTPNQDCLNSLKAEIDVLKNHSHGNIIDFIGSEIIGKMF